MDELLKNEKLTESVLNAMAKKVQFNYPELSALAMRDLRIKTIQAMDNIVFTAGKMAYRQANQNS